MIHVFAVYNRQRLSLIKIKWTNAQSACLLIKVINSVNLFLQRSFLSGERNFVRTNLNHQRT